MSDPKTNIFSDEELAALKKLETLLEKKEKTVTFNDDEIAVIKKVVELYKSFAAIGYFGSAAKNIVIWIGVMLGAYFTFTEFVAKYIKIRIGG